MSSLALLWLAVDPADPGAFTLTSSAFRDREEIPALYTCEGGDVSVPLAWKGAPADTKSFALIVDDPDAPDPKAPHMTWVHWVLYNLPADTTALDEGVSALPPGTMEGLNDFQRTGYGGPCPPVGRHRYFFKLYALDRTMPYLYKPTKEELLLAMQGHVLAQANLMGTYEK